MLGPCSIKTLIFGSVILAALLPDTAIAANTVDPSRADKRSTGGLNNIIIHGQRPVREAVPDQNQVIEAAIENAMNSERMKQYADQTIAESMQRLQTEVEIGNDVIKFKQGVTYQVN